MDALEALDVTFVVLAFVVLAPCADCVDVCTRANAEGSPQDNLSPRVIHAHMHKCARTQTQYLDARTSTEAAQTHTHARRCQVTPADIGG